MARMPATRIDGPAAAVELTRRRAGVAVGFDAGQPLALPLVGPSPMTVTVVASIGLGRVLALRLAAAGARVSVHTGRPAEWAELPRLTGGGSELISVLALGARTPRPEGGQPLAVIFDGGAAPDQVPEPADPWQSVIVLLPFADDRALPTIDASQVLALNSPTAADEAIIARSRFAATFARAETPTGDQVLWLSGPTSRLASLGATTIEQGLGGSAPPHP